MPFIIMTNLFIKSLFVLIVFNIYFIIQINSTFKRVCYLRVDSSSSIDVQTINGSLCTHIILGFAVIANGTIAPKHPNDVLYYQNVTQLKLKYTDLKIMLSVGGGGVDGTDFHTICSNQTDIDRFVSSALDLLLKYNFDGLDVDWEFPAWNTPYPQDKFAFTQLLKTMKSQFTRQLNCIDNRRELVLSCAVSAIINVVDAAYDMPEMAKYVDFVNIMSYDFHQFTPYWPFTGYNAPLFGRKVEKTYFTLLNTNRSVDYWVRLGMSKDKIMVGIPTYGHTYRLADRQHTGPDSAAIEQLGDMTYPQICQLIQNQSSRVSFDTESMVPYLVNEDLWVTYDDNTSVALKAKWIRDNGFAGSMTFDLNSDDYNYVCDKTSKFVLNSVIYSLLN